MAMTLELVDEFRLRPAQVAAIRDLLAESFPDSDFPATRSYYKQIPARRLLATLDGRLVGQAGIEHRVIGTETGPASIFGLIDVCVTPAQRGRGIASSLLRETAALAAEHGIDFLVLFARDSRIYEKNGFRRATNTLRWAKIHEHRLLGIGEEPIEELMVSPVGKRPWPDGLVDLLGYQF